MITCVFPASVNFELQAVINTGTYACDPASISNLCSVVINTGRQSGREEQVKKKHNRVFLLRHLI